MDRTNYCAECEQHAREVSRLTAELAEARERLSEMTDCTYIEDADCYIYADAENGQKHEKYLSGLLTDLAAVKEESAETCRKLLEDNHRLELTNAELQTELAEARESTGRLEVKLFEQESTNRKLGAELAEAREDSRRLDYALRWLLDTQGIEMPTDSWESWIAMVAGLCSRGRNLIGAMEEAQDEINDERAAIDAGKGE
jgi:septal ring factor EnvC (AmiA/AmiB activator)